MAKQLRKIVALGTLLFALMSMLLACSTKVQKTTSENDYANCFHIDQDKKELTTFLEGGQKAGALSYKKLSIKKVVVMNTTAIAYFQKLDLLETVVGVANLDRLATGLFKKGQVQEVGDFEQVNVERILSLAPDLIVCNAYQKNQLKALNVPKLDMNEYMEKHPLAKLEWYKVFGVLFGKEKLSMKLYNEERDRYEQLASVAEEGADVERVLQLGNMSGTFLSAPCKGVMAQFVRDAGGEMLCKKKAANDKIVPSLSEEEVRLMMSKADYLLYFDWRQSPMSLSKIKKELAMNEDAVHKVIYCNTLTNSFFEKSQVEPSAVLRQFQSIFTGQKTSTSYFTVLNP